MFAGISSWWFYRYCDYNHICSTTGCHTGLKLVPSLVFCFCRDLKFKYLDATVANVQVKHDAKLQVPDIAKLTFLKLLFPEKPTEEFFNSARQIGDFM